MRTHLKPCFTAVLLLSATCTATAMATTLTDNPAIFDTPLQLNVSTVTANITIADLTTDLNFLTIDAGADLTINGGKGTDSMSIDAALNGLTVETYNVNFAALNATTAESDIQTASPLITAHAVVVELVSEAGLYAAADTVIALTSDTDTLDDQTLTALITAKTQASETFYAINDNLFGIVAGGLAINGATAST